MRKLVSDPRWSSEESLSERIEVVKEILPDGSCRGRRGKRALVALLRARRRRLEGGHAEGDHAAASVAEPAANFPASAYRAKTLPTAWASPPETARARPQEPGARSKRQAAVSVARAGGLPGAWCCR